MKRFTVHRDVVVYPTQALLRPPWVLFRGGPDWPWFWLRRGERHCRYRARIPLDIRPRREGAIAESIEPGGVWCGPISQHFGHAIANFGSRIAEAGLAPHDCPLVFSAHRDEIPPAFFWQMLDHFRIEPRRVRIVARPTRFASLTVAPQAEPLYGDGPDSGHLDLLDRLAGPAPPPDGSRLYVSRAGLWKGKTAGEAAIEAALARAGYRTIRPETMPLADQLAAYRRAATLVFAEGSALHGLQLLGRVSADVIVVARRRGCRLAESAIRPRVRSLRYVDAVIGTVRGLDRNGRPQLSAGITILDDARLVDSLERAGIPIASAWSPRSFEAQRDADVARWADARMAHRQHPGEAGAIRRSLRDLGMDETIIDATDAERSVPA